MDAQTAMQESLRSLILEVVNLTRIALSQAKVLLKRSNIFTALLTCEAMPYSQSLEIFCIQKNKSVLRDVFGACLLGVQRRNR
jgi:hypothetical protein